MEIVGVLFVSVVCALAIISMIGKGIFLLGVGGPSKFNWGYMIVMVALSAAVATAWWFLVGTHIHLEFG